MHANGDVHPVVPSTELISTRDAIHAAPATAPAPTPAPAPAIGATACSGEPTLTLTS